MGGEIRSDVQQNTRTGVRVVCRLNRRQGLMFDFSTGLATAFGADADIVSLAYQFMWRGKM